MGKIQLIAVIFDVILLTVILKLIQRGSLKEKYAILWLLGLSLLLVLTLSRPILEKVSLFFGVFYPPSFLFLLAFFVVLMMLLHFSVAISALEKKCKVLAQKLAFLEQALKPKKGEKI